MPDPALAQLLADTDPRTGVPWAEWDRLTRRALADWLEDRGFPECSRQVRAARGLPPAETVAAPAGGRLAWVSYASRDVEVRLSLCGPGRTERLAAAGPAASSLSLWVGELGSYPFTWDVLGRPIPGGAFRLPLRVTATPGRDRGFRPDAGAPVAPCHASLWFAVPDAADRVDYLEKVTLYLLPLRWSRWNVRMGVLHNLRSDPTQMPAGEVRRLRPWLPERE